MDPDDYIVLYSAETGGAVAEHRHYPALRAPGATPSDAISALSILVERAERDEVHQLRSLVSAVRQVAADDKRTPEQVLAAIRYLLRE